MEVNPIRFIITIFVMRILARFIKKKNSSLPSIGVNIKATFGTKLVTSW